ILERLRRQVVRPPTGESRRLPEDDVALGVDELYRDRDLDLVLEHLARPVGAAGCVVPGDVIVADDAATNDHVRHLSTRRANPESTRQLGEELLVDELREVEIDGLVLERLNEDGLYAGREPAASAEAVIAPAEDEQPEKQCETTVHGASRCPVRTARHVRPRPDPASVPYRSPSPC